MRLFEKHKNGAIIDMDGDSAVVAKQLVEWRAYQDSKEQPKRQTGFVPKEEEESNE
jgi:hypothetical protein